MFVHELYTGMIPKNRVAVGSAQQGKAKILGKQRTGERLFDRSGELPGRFALGTKTTGENNVVLRQGSGHGYPGGHSGGTHCGAHCGEEVS